MRTLFAVMVAVSLMACGGTDCTPGMWCEPGAVVTCDASGDLQTTPCAGRCLYASTVNPQTGTVHSVPRCEVVP